MRILASLRLHLSSTVRVHGADPRIAACSFQSDSAAVASARVGHAAALMFFASRVLLGATKLSALTSKRGNKNYFKGRGAKSLGYKGTKGQQQR